MGIILPRRSMEFEHSEECTVHGRMVKRSVFVQFHALNPSVQPDSGVHSGFVNTSINLTDSAFKALDEQT